MTALDEQLSAVMTAQAEAAAKLRRVREAVTRAQSAFARTGSGRDLAIAKAARREFEAAKRSYDAAREACDKACIVAARSAS